MSGFSFEMRWLAAAWLAGSLCSHCASAATFYVGGSESACTHHTLQDAVDAVPDGTPS